MPSKTVFLIGPGFIGLHILDLLHAASYPVTTLVRNPAKATYLANSGATLIEGTLSSSALITEQTAKHDITIHAATADDLPSVRAVLAGIRQRAAGGQPTTYIHTSGTSVLDDGSRGAFRTEKVYADTDPGAIDALADDAPHRPIDLEIVRAARELGEKARIAIMVPPAIYGFSARHGRLSIQVPTLARFALLHGYAGYVGRGESVESQVHVADLARGYAVLLRWLVEEPGAGREVLANPYFFCENGREFSWREVAEEVGKSLFGKGLIKEEARTIPEELYKDLFGDWTTAVVGLNSRSRAVRLRQLGWEPKEKGIWESWNEDELPELLKEEGLGKSSAYM